MTKRSFVRSSFLCAAVSLICSATSWAAPSATPTYKEVADILSSNCVSCHSAEFAYADVLLDSEAGVLKNAAASLDAIKTGFMPLGQEGFADTAEGKALIQFLEAATASPVPVKP